MNESKALQSPKPELMSPAGHWPQLEAAIAAGADAVYFGLQHFTARAKVGFVLEELPEVIRRLHRDGVKGFVTFNTLVFDHELHQAEQAIAAIAASGADAIIVQDVGIAGMARQVAPDLDVHGSTQMSITSAEGAELAASLGCSRVVLGRELGLKDIRRIAEATDVELEVFVHGALCVSYSGQCFSSEAWGGRSANRGQCAQACRLSYDLIVDGQQRDLADARYLLSPGDLYAIEQIPELTEIGVACFKIEGRYKDADYVTLTTRAYRAAIDQAVGDMVDGSLSVSKTDLEQVYSRGLGPHFIGETNHQNVVVGRAPRHRGQQVGKVARVNSDGVLVSANREIKAGDGVVFDSADWRSPEQAEEGGNVFSVSETHDGLHQLTFGNGAIDFARIRTGDLVWRTRDPQLAKKSKRIRNAAVRTTGVLFRVEACPGTSLVVIAEATSGETARFECEELLQPAKNKALDLATVREQLGRLGQTPFHLESVDLVCDKPTFCPVSILNLARREVVQQLLAAREQVPDRKISPMVRSVEKETPAETVSVADVRPQMHLLVRTPQQLDGAIELQPDSVTLDYLDLYGLRTSVERLREHNIGARVASPRILKPSEQKVVRFLLSLDCQILVRSGGLLFDLAKRRSEASGSFPELHGDFSLNAANELAFEKYLQMGLSRIAPTYDLNAEQIEDLAGTIKPERGELVVFHHLPVFHTEHCVFCRFLSNGTDNTNCGHPCEKHVISLKDNSGRRHAVLADVGCRNTVFGAEAQVASSFLPRWLEAGFQHFRLEFVHQDAAEVIEIGTALRDFLSGDASSQQLEQRWAKHSSQGTTDGSLYVPKDFKQLVQLNSPSQ